MQSASLHQPGQHHRLTIISSHVQHAARNIRSSSLPLLLQRQIPCLLVPPPLVTRLLTTYSPCLQPSKLLVCIDGHMERPCICKRAAAEAPGFCAAGVHAEGTSPHCLTVWVSSTGGLNVGGDLIKMLLPGRFGAGRPAKLTLFTSRAAEVCNPDSCAPAVHRARMHSGALANRFQMQWCASCAPC